MHRRGFLRILGGIGTPLALAGCTTTEDGDGDDDGAGGPTDRTTDRTTGTTTAGDPASTRTTAERTTAADTTTGTATTTTDAETTTTGTEIPGRTIPQVSTRDRYAVEDGEVVEREYDRLYDVVGSVPGYTQGTASPDDLVVLVHGVGMDVEGATEWFEDSADALRAVGYEGAIAGFSYDARAGLTQLTEVRAIARENRRHLGEFLRAYAGRSPGTRIRLVGHSQGGMVVLATVRYLHEVDWSGTVESVTLLAAAVERTTVALDGTYGPALAARVNEVDNFWDDNDTTMSVGYYVATGERSLGSNPSKGETPENFEDHEVTYVPSHDEYLHPVETGAADEVVAEWADED